MGKINQVLGDLLRHGKPTLPEIFEGGIAPPETENRRYSHSLDYAWKHAFLLLLREAPPKFFSQKWIFGSWVSQTLY